jgi:hypothetical protein
MSPDELAGDVRTELELIAETVEEATRLAAEVRGRSPTVREKTAGGAFVAQFYSGIENILKRLCRFHNVEMPEGGAWHLELFEWFCAPAHSSLPVLFGETLAERLAAYRRFRHVVRHSYGLQLEWDEMETGLEQLEDVFNHVRHATLGYTDSLNRPE